MGGGRAAEPDDQGAGHGGGRAGGARADRPRASTSTSRCCSGARCTRRSRARTSKGWRIARAGRAPTGDRQHRQRRQLLRQPHRHQRRQAAGREDRAARPAPSGSAWSGCTAKSAIANARLAYQSYKRIFARAALGGAGGEGRAQAAPAVGEHQREEPALPRRDVRRGADWRRDDRHHADRDAARPSASTARRGPAWRATSIRRRRRWPSWRRPASRCAPSPTTSSSTASRNSRSRTTR